MTIIDRILLELSAKEVVEDGLPDFTNEKHLLALNEVLIDLDWPMEARGELLYTLMEKENTEDKYPAVSIDDTGDGKGKKKTVYFKSKEKRDAAIKAGTHEKSSEKDSDDKNNKKQSSTKVTDFERQPTGTDKTGSEEKPKKLSKAEKKEIKKKKHDAARKKSQAVREKIYGKDTQGTLIGDGDTPKEQSDLEIKQLCLEHGYEDFEKDAGRGKPAPGNAGSMFNEIISGEGTSILEQEPDLEEEDLARTLYDQYCGTKLGDEIKSSTHAGVPVADIPEDITGDEKGCYAKCLVTARSAKRKHQRAQESADAVREAGVEFGEIKKIHSFYGHGESLDAQVAIIKQKLKEGKKVLAPDGTEITDVMSEEKLYELITTGGGGENPSDTATFIEDEDGNLILNFTSDKMTTGDQQANSTLINEINNRKKGVDKLLKGNKISDEQKKDADTEIERHKNEVDKEQSKLQSIVAPIGTNLLKEAEEDEAVLDTLMEEWESDANGQDTSAHWTKLQDAIAKDNGWEKPYTEEQKRCAAKLLLKVAENESNRPTDPKTDKPTAKNKPTVEVNKDCKTKRWLNGSQAKLMARTAENQNIAGKEGYNIKENIETIRKNIITMERNHLKKLNETKVDVDGVEKGLGELLEGQQVSDQLHLSMMDGDENHPMMNNGLFEVNMGGHPVNKEVLQKCLAEGKEDFTSKDFIKGFRVMSPDVEEDGDRYTWNCTINTGTPPEFDENGNVIDSGKCKDGSDRRATGRVMYLYAITGDNKLIKVGQKNMRTKTGDLGKYDTVVVYHDDMQECIKTGEYPK